MNKISFLILEHQIGQQGNKRICQTNGLKSVTLEYETANF